MSFCKKVLLLCGLLLPFLAQANGESMQQFGDYQVHYSVFNTSFLQPEVAATYRIVRSADTAMINIAVLKKQADGSYANVTASVSGNQYDLIRHDPLTFQEVREQHAIYYLATLPIHHRIDVYFTVDVSVDGQQPMKVQFSKRLYRDE